MNPSRAALQHAFELALAHHRAGELAQAEQIYRDILAVDPRHAEALRLLALIASDAGYLEEAGGLLRRALAAAPRNAELQNSLGSVRRLQGDLSEAEKCYRLAIKRHPGYAAAMSNLSALLNQQFRLAEAVDWARRAAAIEPDFAALNNLANALVKLGLAEEAVEAYRRCVAVAPRHWLTWSNLLLGLHYLPDVSPDELFAMHVRVGKGLSEGLGEPAPLLNSRDPARRLRVGYVSADFRMGSVSHFIQPILENHDRSAVEVFCYADVGKPDEITERAKASASAWRAIRGVPNEALAQIVREDRIDLLVDLAGHTLDRLQMFARRAAPVQVTYLGYPDTTGVPAMDYRLTDSFADPAGEAEARATERLFRIDPCAWCYGPLGPTPEVGPPREGPVTFGCFNVLAKVSAPAIDAWARILREVPGSRLAIKTFSMDDAAARERFIQAMGARGIERERLLLHGHRPDLQQHLALYHELDIALDPFPYQGTTTTCDALWMGVPVVSLAGRIHASRVGVSLLNAVGLGELVAADTESYVRLAVSLAGDRDRLARLRGGLRERMRRSPLTDAPGFCRRLEAAYRQMWHGFCREAPL